MRNSKPGRLATNLTMETTPTVPLFSADGRASNVSLVLREGPGTLAGRTSAL
jgi:hypothetical protein